MLCVKTAERRVGGAMVGNDGCELITIYTGC